MADTSLMLPGSWNTTPAVSVVQFASDLEVIALVWNVAIGIYHFLLVYALNKYGMDIWFRIRDRSDSISWWKTLGINYGQIVTSPVMEDEVLRRKLELLAEKGWGTATSPPKQELGKKEAAQAVNMAAGEEAEDGDEDRDEGEPTPTTISHSLSCSLVLAFQCALSDEQIYKWADKMRKMFGSTPRVERFERSTIVQTNVWTHEGLLHDAAALVEKACEENPQCTLQVDTWAVFLNDSGSSTGEKVKLIKFQGLSVPVITSTSQSSAVDMIEIRGIHLDEADLIAQTHDQSMRLLSTSKASGDSEELEVLCVQCPPDALHQDLHVYASKTIAVNGFLISVQCEPVKVVSADDNISTTDSTTWIMAAFVMTVPVTQIAFSLLYPSSESPLAITVGQGLGWMLGWLTQKFLTARNPSNQGKALKPVEKKEELRPLSETGLNQDAVLTKPVPSKPAGGKGEELRPLSETGLNQDAVSSTPIPSKPAIVKKDFFIYFWRGGWVVLIVLLILLSHWLWTHMGEFEKKWLLVGTTTATICIIIFKLQAKLRRTRDEKIVSPSRYWMNLMSTAITYNEWTHAASMLHSHCDFNDAKLYDEAYIQGKLRELQTRRMEGTTQEILFFLRADLIRHLGNMCNPNLHKCRNEVPAVIRDYINEVRYHLQAVCEMDVEEFTLEEKLTFLTETRQRFGRTALVFSGHVALGTFHSSVFRTLVEHQLLPSVLVGANLGAIVASFATTRTASELQHFFDDPSLPMDFYEKLSTVYVAAYRLRTQEARPYEIEKLQQSMQDLLGDLTFEEAFDLSGRILGISIPACPIGHQPAQFLNYLASPHVVIWSAVAVSCVPPSGLHRPELMIKDRYDRIVPYVPPTKMTFQKAGSETSLETEIPFRQVEELFNVNHFIVSQASPYIAAWIYFKETAQERSPLAAKFVNMMEMEVRHRCAQLSDMGIRMRGLTSLCAQKWEGDINITLPITFSQAISISTTQNEDPSPNELRKAAMVGRRCTWAKLSAIHASCGIELMLDEYINELHRRERHALHRGEDYHRLNDLASLKGTRQSDQLDFSRLTRANVNTAQSSQGDYTSNVNDELPLEHLTPGYCTPSEAETEDYLLDHLCSCASNKPESLMRCDMAPAVSDQGVQLIVEDCDTIDDNHGAVGDITWSGESGLPDELTIEDHLQQPVKEEHVVESVCEQYKLHNRDLQFEWDIGCEDVDSYGSPTTVLEGPSGRSRMQVRKVVDRITHPGCNLERYFEEMSNSSYHLDERDDNI